MDLISERERVLAALKEEVPGSDEYSTLLRNLENLNELMKPAWKKVFLNQGTLGELSRLGLILLVLNYEKADVITSRAFNFIRPK